MNVFLVLDGPHPPPQDRSPRQGICRDVNHSAQSVASGRIYASLSTVVFFALAGMHLHRNGSSKQKRHLRIATITLGSSKASQQWQCKSLCLHFLLHISLAVCSASITSLCLDTTSEGKPVPQESQNFCCHDFFSMKIGSPRLSRSSSNSAKMLRTATYLHWFCVCMLVGSPETAFRLPHVVQATWPVQWKCLVSMLLIHFACYNFPFFFCKFPNFLLQFVRFFVATFWKER